MNLKKILQDKTREYMVSICGGNQAQINSFINLYDECILGNNKITLIPNVIRYMKDVEREVFLENKKEGLIKKERIYIDSIEEIISEYIEKKDFSKINKEYLEILDASNLYMKLCETYIGNNGYDDILINKIKNNIKKTNTLREIIFNNYKKESEISEEAINDLYELNLFKELIVLKFIDSMIGGDKIGFEEQKINLFNFLQENSEIANEKITYVISFLLKFNKVLDIENDGDSILLEFNKYKGFYIEWERVRISDNEFSYTYVPMSNVVDVNELMPMSRQFLEKNGLVFSEKMKNVFNEESGITLKIVGSQCFNRDNIYSYNFNVKIDGSIWDKEMEDFFIEKMRDIDRKRIYQSLNALFQEEDISDLKNDLKKKYREKLLGKEFNEINKNTNKDSMKRKI